jgi:DNA-binding transcriptional LysR family regulator
VDTKQLAALVAVVDRSSFSQAAEQLGVTQPAVSLAIRSLEKRLGCQLIDRSGRVVEPTEAGQVAYRHAQRILGDIWLPRRNRGIARLCPKTRGAGVAFCLRQSGCLSQHRHRKVKFEVTSQRKAMAGTRKITALFLRP